MVKGRVEVDECLFAERDESRTQQENTGSLQGATGVHPVSCFIIQTFLQIERFFFSSSQWQNIKTK